MARRCRARPENCQIARPRLTAATMQAQTVSARLGRFSFFFPALQAAFQWVPGAASRKILAILFAAPGFASGPAAPGQTGGARRRRAGIQAALGAEQLAVRYFLAALDTGRHIPSPCFSVCLYNFFTSVSLVFAEIVCNTDKMAAHDLRCEARSAPVQLCPRSKDKKHRGSRAGPRPSSFMTASFRVQSHETPARCPLLPAESAGIPARVPAQIPLGPPLHVHAARRVESATPRDSRRGSG